MIISTNTCDDLLYSSKLVDTNNLALNYRLDIQGLRAVAIVAVVIYHLNPGWLPGGFVGVDVFFVISGFLITSMLANENLCKQSLIKFYHSRILRLFPAYIVMLMTCVIASYLWLFPAQSIDFAQSLITAVLFVSNMYFAASINYLSIDTHLTPLLHTWSLSVEAQCYVVFPLLLYVLSQYKKINVATTLTAMLALLFVLNLVLTAYNADIAFFSPTVRFYQFLSGAVIAYIPTRINFSKTLMHWGLITGLAMIVTSFFIITPNTNYPGLHSLLPTLGSMLVVFSGRQPQLQFAQLLTNKPMVFIGTISYSLYLWHWPVIVFYKIVFNPSLAVIDYFFLLGLSFLLATVSWYLIENRFRIKAGLFARNDMIIATVITTLTAIAVSGIFLFTNGMRDRYNHQQLYFAETDFSQISRPGKITDGCMIYKNWIESFTNENCVHINTGKINILLLGDSHAEHFRRALEDHSDKFSVSVAVVSGCRPTFPGTGRKTCMTMMQRFYKELINDNKFDVAIVSARWNKTAIERMPDAIKLLKENIKNVVILGPGINYVQSLPILLARHGAALSAFNSNSKLLTYEQTKAVDQRLKSIAVGSGVNYVSLLELTCPNSQCRTLTKAGIPMQWDYGHLTYAGASELIEKFEPLLISQ